MEKDKEIVIEELARKYRISPDKISYILNKYGTIESFSEAYKNGQLDKKDIEVLKDNLRCVIDLSNSNNKALEELYLAIAGEESFIQKDGITIVDLSLLKKQVEQLGNEAYTKILFERFGIETGERRTLQSIANDYGTSANNIRVKEATALRKLRHPARNKKVVLKDMPQYDKLTEEQKAMIDSIFNSNIMFYPDEEYMHEPSDIDRKELSKIFEIDRTEETEVEKVEEVEEDKAPKKQPSILELGFTEATNKVLINLGIKNIEDLLNISERMLEEKLYYSFSHIGSPKATGFQSTRDVMQKRRELMSERGIEEKKTFTLDASIIELEDISRRTAHFLEDGGIITIRDLITTDEEKLMSISGVGEKGISEIRLCKGTLLGRIDIDSLDLPVRVITSLRNSGINNVEELLECSDDQIKDLDKVRANNYEMVISEIKRVKTLILEATRQQESEEDKFLGSVVESATKRVELRGQDEQAKKLEEQYVGQLPKDQPTVDEN